MSPAAFRKIVWKHAHEHGRHSLPWRHTKNAYRILVSEVMLQQTQVERVLPYYRAWITAFPTVKALASASLAEVLVAWQGLGYNRRAKMLHEAAKNIVRDYAGRVPTRATELEKLPGIGAYTARAVSVFSRNTDEYLIETNIRTAIVHHFFTNKGSANSHKVSDHEILAVLARVHPHGKAQTWYAALMDYGAYLKRTGVRTNARMRGHAPQKAFKGSRREARGAILRALTAGPRSGPAVSTLLGSERRAQLTAQLTALVSEGLVEKSGRYYRLPS